MKINQFKKVQTEAKTLKIHIKVRDQFCADLTDQNGSVIFSQDNGYVPDFMPGDHYGDYLILDIDIDTGQVINWEKPDQEDIEKWIQGAEE